MLVEYGGLKRSRVSFPGRSVTLTQYPDALISHHTLPMKGRNLRLWMLNNATMPGEDARGYASPCSVCTPRGNASSTS